MTFITTIPPEEATGVVQDLYAQDQQANGYVPNYTQAFSLRPAVNAAWRTLIGAIRGNMDLRRYELVTLAAAMALRCNYCTLAHGTVLRAKVFSNAQVKAIAQDFRNAGLEPAEVAMMAFAQQVAHDASAITQEDVAALREHGFGDAEILDIILTAAARSFFSKVLDATGAEPDPVYRKLDTDLRAALTVGRPTTEEDGPAPDP